MIRVLFSGGGGAGNEALYRLLGHKYELHFGDADITAIDPIIPADRKHQLPWASDPEFVGKISALCRDWSIDVLIPGVDEELLMFAKNADAFSPTRLLLPDAEYIETMLDKLQMVRNLCARHIPAPFSQTLLENLDNIRFPCIAKPRQGRGSRDVRILKNKNEAISLRSTLGDLAEQTLIQEKINGVEYTVQMIADDKDLLRAIVPVRVDLKRGITIRAETEAELNVMAACQAIHQAIPTSGCYNIQLMLTPEGCVLPFEINPRISTTFCLVVAAGIDPIQIFLGQTPSTGATVFATGMQLRRHWVNVFSNAGV